MVLAPSALLPTLGGKVSALPTSALEPLGGGGGGAAVAEALEPLGRGAWADEAHARTSSAALSSGGGGGAAEGPPPTSAAPSAAPSAAAAAAGRARAMPSLTRAAGSRPCMTRPAPALHGARAGLVQLQVTSRHRGAGRANLVSFEFLVFALVAAYVCGSAVRLRGRWSFRIPLREPRRRGCPHGPLCFLAWPWRDGRAAATSQACPRLSGLLREPRCPRLAAPH